MNFDPGLGWWSPAVFWYVCASVLLCLVFCVVVFVGGWFDLMFLLRSLDETDTESVPKPPDTKNDDAR